MDQRQTSLNRALSLKLTTCYGVGTILGAGIYVLVGKVAGRSGLFTPWAFFLSSLIALFTALSYAELSSNYPKSAGEAAYVDAAFKKRWLSTLVGWMVVLTGIVSTAVMANGFAGYFQVLFPFAEWLIISLLILLLGAIAYWGIKQSVLVSMAITFVEVIGLLIVIFVTRDHFWELKESWREFVPTFEVDSWKGIFLGTFLAFYAFIGFEDIVNVAEEVKQPEKNLPKAILISLLVSTILYVLVSFSAVISLPVEQLQTSDAPLADILQAHGYSPVLIGVISLVAVTNGALVQIVMASRVIYGLSHQKGAPRFFSRIDARTQVPSVATIFVTLATLIMALLFPIVTLAEVTSFIILAVFAMVNSSLIWLKRDPGYEGRLPLFVPVIGFMMCLVFLSIRLWEL